MRPLGHSPPPGRSPSLLLVLSHILLFAFLINTHHNAIAHAGPTPSLPSIVDAGLSPSHSSSSSSSPSSSSIQAVTTASTSTTVTHKASTTTTTTTTATSRSISATRSLVPAPPPIISTKSTPAQPTSSPPFLPKRCRDCPPNNNLGLTCFKNTICVPLTLLCDIGYLTNTTVGTNSTAKLNQCMDITGPASETDPFTCQEQLCYATNFLPLPSPGKGHIDRNSSTTCTDGSYFSLYGSSDPGGAMRYTQSCVPQDQQPNSPTTPVCKDWEYPTQSSCLLKTCGPYLDCVSPWVCKKSTINGIVATYGLCMSANSTADPGGDDSSNGSPHDRLIIGVLVGVCSLVLGVGVGTAVCHYRKRRMRQMVMQNLVRNDASNQKPSLMTTLHTYFDACCCCFYGRNIELRRDGLDTETASEGGAQEPRVLSVTESEIQASSLNSSHRSNLIFARRWVWGAGRNTGEATSGPRIGLTTGGVAVLPEIEPPPVYHQGPDLPSYRDMNSIPLTSITRPTSVTDQTSPESSEATTERATSPTPKQPNEALQNI